MLFTEDTGKVQGSATSPSSFLSFPSPVRRCSVFFQRQSEVQVGKRGGGKGFSVIRSLILDKAEKAGEKA